MHYLLSTVKITLTYWKLTQLRPKTAYKLIKSHIKNTEACQQVIYLHQKPKVAEH